jgi:hypothetical protein
MQDGIVIIRGNVAQFSAMIIDQSVYQALKEGYILRLRRIEDNIPQVPVGLFEECVERRTFLP